MYYSSSSQSSNVMTSSFGTDTRSYWAVTSPPSFPASQIVDALVSALPLESLEPKRSSDLASLSSLSPVTEAELEDEPVTRNERLLQPWRRRLVLVFAR
ncbi:hypothetical protein PC120_g10955 [Phytophthora cactorum]|nr:hypothetical protein PC120_g10955 [Phytophthora cactorum]